MAPAPAAPAEAVRQLLADGWCVVPDVLTPDESADALARLWAAAEAWQARGNDSHMPVLDPNAANVRVFDLLDLDPLFRDLIRRPVAMALVRALLGPDAMISNFTANIARPGSKSMSLHSDQALVVPEPWLAPWSINIIWCLTDARGDNGATLFIPGSQKVTRRDELGPDPGARLVPFEAKAGSIVAMDGRVWHTSGANITANEDRALLFGYYSRGFLRPQVNWNATLSAQTQGQLDREFRWLLGLDGAANFSLAGELLGADLAGAKADT